MTRSALARASDLLESAAAGAEAPDAADRLADIADQLDTLAGGEHGPDHGRLARIQIGLDEVQGEVDDNVAGRIDEALSAIVSYRETIEGV